MTLSRTKSNYVANFQGAKEFPDFDYLDIAGIQGEPQYHLRRPNVSK